MQTSQKLLFVDASSGFYRVKRYKLGDYFGPVDLGLHVSGRTMSLNFGVGLFAGSILPGSNRLIFSGFSPCWRSFFISSMGGAGLIFDNLGINMVSLVGKAPRPSILYLNRLHGEEIEVEIEAVELAELWKPFREAGYMLGTPSPAPRPPRDPRSREGAYALLDYALERYGKRYESEYRAFAVGPAALSSDFGAILSAPVKNGKASDVDTWAGRGGFGSKMLQEHGIAAVIYGGTVIDEDFRDRRVADQWFEEKYRQKTRRQGFRGHDQVSLRSQIRNRRDLSASITPRWAGSFSPSTDRTTSWTEEARKELLARLVTGHYLKQFNEETIATKSQATCGEPCAAVCKKLRGEFKKDYEPYQALGPLCGIFDQRAAERVNRASDSSGFDAISLGGVLAWLMDCLDRGELSPEELGVIGKPRWNSEAFDAVADSEYNADLCIELIDSILMKRGILDLSEGPRKWARRVRREKGPRILDRFVATANGERAGWYRISIGHRASSRRWLSWASTICTMARIFCLPVSWVEPAPKGLKRNWPWTNAGLCRFHRAWGEEMMVEAMGLVYGLKDEYLAAISVAASRINSRNSAVFWESEADLELVRTFLKRRRDVEKDPSPVLETWIQAFDTDPKEAALDFWFRDEEGYRRVASGFSVGRGQEI